MDEEQSRRRFPRIPSANAVLVKKVGEEGLEGFAKTRTIGMGGCGFRSEERLEPGSVLELLISVSRSVLRSKARVVYEKCLDDGAWEVGVEFLELDPEDRKVLEKLLS
jgi:hypothetical protein